MSSQHRQRNEVKRLYEAALEIVDERNLYTIKQQIQKHVDGSFGEYLRQNFKAEVYEQWWNDLQHSFAKVGLNFLKFKKHIMLTKKKDEHEIAPPGYLMIAIVELERMISGKDYLDDYKLSAKATQSWPNVKYRKGVVDNGVDIHDFKKYDNKDAIELLDKLWVGRKVVSPTNTLLKEGKPTKWEELGTLNKDSVKSTANAINKAMRDKHINLRIKHPVKVEGVFLWLQQKSTE
jgi:hypothetical protein